MKRIIAKPEKESVVNQTGSCPPRVLSQLKERTGRRGERHKVHYKADGNERKMTSAMGVQEKNYFFGGLFGSGET